MTNRNLGKSPKDKWFRRDSGRWMLHVFAETNSSVGTNFPPCSASIDYRFTPTNYKYKIFMWKNIYKRICRLLFFLLFIFLFGNISTKKLLLTLLGINAGRGSHDCKGSEGERLVWNWVALMVVVKLVYDSLV